MLKQYEFDHLKKILMPKMKQDKSKNDQLTKDKKATCGSCSY